MGILGSGAGRVNKTPPSTYLRVQTAINGKPIPLVYGQTRIAGNLIWYGDFKSQSGGSGGGKGGGGGGGKSGSSGSGTTYSASVMIALCQGPIAGLGVIYENATFSTLALKNMTLFTGTYAQGAWGFLVSNHPGYALFYRGIAYVAAAPLDLGSSNTLPNENFEVVAFTDSALPATGFDAAPDFVLTDFLTDPLHGIGFPAANLGSLATFRAFTVANGLVVSPAIVDATEGRQFIVDLMTATNCECVWSSGKLTVVPYGDQAITANGYSYSPPAAPLYALTDDDFKPIQGANNNSTATGGTQDPVQCTRLRPSDAMNTIQIEYLARGNYYNPDIVEAKDEASISIYGQRRADLQTLHLFCLQSAAAASAQMQLGRQAVRNTYAFTVGQEYILLDPMDIIAISDVGLGLVQQWVRITEITENQDNTLTIQAEEYLAGTGAAPYYASQASQGFSADANAAAGVPQSVVIWEPTWDLAGALEVWLAVAGNTNWGGCDIWVSADDMNYVFAGTLDGTSMNGVLTASLATVTPASSGPTIDVTHTLAVDMAPGATQLLGGTASDMLAANTLCYVDGEYLAYEAATLTAGFQYNLTVLNRGLYGTLPGAHNSGVPIVRVAPGTVFRFGVSSDRPGQSLYFKILPWNHYGGGQPGLADVAAWGYVIQGTALYEALADVTSLTTVYQGPSVYLSWTEIADWRPVLYEVRKGAVFASAQAIAAVAHPPFLVTGDDTYWVVARTTPAPGVTVYSPSPPDLAITGSVINSYVVASWNEGATSWSGTRGGSAVISGSNVVTSGTPQTSGTYQVPAGHEIDLLYPTSALVMIAWTSTGQPVGQNILVFADWLGSTDILGAASTRNTSIYPEIAISQDAVTFAAWQKWTPGVYVGRKFRARMQLVTNDGQTQAVLESFIFNVLVPGREDHYTGLSVPAIGVNLAFKPDGAAAAAAFQGGPNGSSSPAVQVTILNAVAGDQLYINGGTAGSQPTLSGCFIQILNGGAGVIRVVNVLAQGF